MIQSAENIKKELYGLKDDQRKKILESFFKTGKGQYGEGDIFLGIMVPLQRIIAKKYATIGHADILLLLKSPIHEHRLTALLIMVSQYNKSKTIKNKKQIFDLYLSNTEYINNWDLVDTSARYIVGDYIYNYNSSRKILYKLAYSKNIWQRRIAIVSTHYFISQNNFDDIYHLTVLLIQDTHDLIHKALGWMLREVGKRDEDSLKSFLDIYSQNLPRTTLRYAIEHFSFMDKKKYMNKKMPVSL